MAGEPKSGARNRREFVRTRVPLAERISSVAIILVIVGIAVAIAYKGRHFDPNRYNVRTDALKSTAAAVAGKAGTVTDGSENTVPLVNSLPAGEETPAGEEMPGEEDTAHSANADQPAATGAPLQIAITGIKPMADTEFYNPDNLFEKIDGRAPAYQSFNVQQLRCRSFSLIAQPDSYVDVYEYRFDSPVDAFGMFALERDPKGQALDFAPDGYSGGLGYYFRQGSVYVQVIASDAKAETLRLAKEIAQNRAKQLPVDDHGLAGRRKLPSAGLIADSVSYVPENAQGQAAFKDVFQANYRFEDSELPFFIMVAKPKDAAKAWQSFHDFCARFGKVESLPDMGGAQIFSAHLFGKWKVVFLREGELGGVYDAADATKARGFLEKYLRGEIK